MDTADYARLILSMCDIPVYGQGQKGSKGVVEGLHVLFTLFVEFRNN